MIRSLLVFIFSLFVSYFVCLFFHLSKVCLFKIYVSKKKSISFISFKIYLFLIQFPYIVIIVLHLDWFDGSVVPVG